MALVIFIVCALVVFCLDSGKQKEQKEKYERMKATGYYDKSDREVFSKLLQDFDYNWRKEGGTYVPEKYREYCRHCKQARVDYWYSWVQNEEWKMGLKPFYCRTIRPYNKYDFDAFEWFREHYDWKAKVFNETGRVYY